jgi:glycosyltransferase involved in cell wall biosynthesis
MTRERAQRAVCIYGGHVADALKGSRMKGGAEVQMALLGKALAMAGMRVTILDPECRELLTPVENLTVKGVPHWYEGIHGIRFFASRLPNLLRTLRETNAAVFFARGFSYRFLLVWAAARSLHAPFALSSASDYDLLGFRERYRRIYRGRFSVWGWLSTVVPNEIGHALLLRLADVVLVQNDRQEALARGRARRSMRLNNIVEDATFGYGRPKEANLVAVVGTLSAYKNLFPLVEIATRLPEWVFEVIGEVTDEEGQRVRTALEALPNVRLKGALNRTQTLERIAAASVLLNTSIHEGFPNTFLEAWCVGTTVVSLAVDPNGVISRYGLGIVCGGDPETLIVALRTGNYAADPERMRKYVQEFHSGARAVRLFDDLLDGRSQPITGVSDIATSHLS